MPWITPFFQQNIVLVYFFYGLAFFSMGLAILVETRRTSTFNLADALVPFAGFGIVHGLHEWFEMFELLAASGAAALPSWLLSPSIRIAHLVLSFILLLVFGVQLIVANRRDRATARRYGALAAMGMLLLWLVTWLLTLRVMQAGPADAIGLADVLARYMLAMPGAGLAAWAIWMEQRTFQARGMAQFGRTLLWAAVAILAYGVVGQIFTRETALAPSTVINQALFLRVTGVPVQFYRTCMAVAMAVIVIRALRLFETERSQQLHSAENASQQADRDLQAALLNLTTLNRLSWRLSQTLDQDVLLHEVFPRFVADEPRVGASMILLKRQAEDGDSAEIVARTECQAPPKLHDIMVATAAQIGQRVCHTGQPAFWDEHAIIDLPIDDDTPNTPWHATAPASVRIIGTPMHSQDGVLGALVACNPPNTPPFTISDFALFSTAARQFSVALQNAVLYGEAQQREALRGELLRQVVNAQEQERQRIARELHDGPGQTLTALGLGLAATTERLKNDPAAASRQITELKGLGNTALQEIRDIIADLRPSLLDDLGLIPALRSQLQGVEARSALRTQLDVTGPRRRLSPEQETIVFRIVQEALTNVIKHANASRVTVHLAFSDSALTATVHDDGRGFAVERALSPIASEQKHWGLLGMQERVSLVGGACTIDSAIGAGTTVTIHIQLDTVETPQPAISAAGDSHGHH